MTRICFTYVSGSVMSGIYCGRSEFGSLEIGLRINIRHKEHVDTAVVWVGPT